MQSVPEAAPRPRHDAFISYSRKNEAFASLLEKVLENYQPPSGLQAPRRHLEIFRDKQDFTGNEYHSSLERHLKDSAKLIVICSPEACQSEYVNDEVRQFARLKGPSDIIPILISGIPNNEAKVGEEALRAFPPALCAVNVMPLAADFRGFVAGKNRINRGAYQDAWYTVLANIYDVPRAEIEQRDRKRQARARRITAGVAVVILGLIAAALAVAFWSNQQGRAKARDARQLRYIGNIGLAQQAYHATDLTGMVQLLKADIPSALPAADDLRGFEWYYLWRLSQGPNATVTAHVPSVKAVAFSPDGKLFATGSDGDVLRLWSAESGKAVSDLGGQARDATRLAFSPDGKMLATAGGKNPVRLWDISSRSMTAEIQETGDSVERVAFSPDGRALAAIGLDKSNANKVARAWDTASRRLIGTMIGAGTASGSGMFLAFSPDGATLAMSSGFGVKLCRFPSGETITEFDAASAYVTEIAFAPDGKMLVAGSEDGKLLFFDLASRAKPATLDAHDGYVSGVAFSADGKLLITAGADKTVKLWDARSHTAISTLKGHAGEIHAIAISPDGRTVASASADQTVRLWEVASRPEYEELSSLGIIIAAIAASPGENKLAIASASTIVIWDPSARKELARLDGHRESINDVAFSPDGKTLAIASSDKAVELWDTISGKTERLVGHTGLVHAVAFSPDGRLLASASEDHSVRLWDPAGRALPVLLPAQTKAVTAVVFSPDGRMLASAGNDHTVRLCDVESGHEVASAPAFAATFQIPPDIDEDQQPLVTSVAFSPDGQLLATAGVDAVVTLWGVAKGTLQRLATLTGHTGVVNDVAFSPDGRTIATAASDATVRLWNASLFRELINFPKTKGGRSDVPEFLRGSENHVSAVAFSRDGQFLATGLIDGTVRFRRAATNAQIAARE